MNRLQERRVGLGMLQAEVARRLKAVEGRVDVSMVSRYEKGVCLPTKAQLEELERALAMDRAELYDPAELDLLGIGPDLAAPDGTLTGGRPRKDRRSREYYRKCFRISRKQEEALPEDLLEVCGFASWQSWFDHGMRMLMADYAAKVRRCGRRKE